MTIKRANKTLSMRTLWPRVPLDALGDPAFATLDACTGAMIPSIREVFTDEQIVLLVNRALYAMLYQRETHKRAYERARATKP